MFICQPGVQSESAPLRGKCMEAAWQCCLRVCVHEKTVTQHVTTWLRVQNMEFTAKACILNQREMTAD